MRKVIQWATGTVGRYAASRIDERDDMELVGLYTTNVAKAGRSAAELLGAGESAVVATNDIDQILAMDADIVVHAPLASMVYNDNPAQDLDDICALLASGKNVITVVGYLYPYVHPQEVVDRLRASCAEGGVSFHSTGLNPGWMGDILPLSMSALAGQIDHIHILEISNFQSYPPPEIMFESMGFGAPEDVFRQQNAKRATWLDSLFAESIGLLGAGLGVQFERFDSSVELALAPHDLETAAGTVREGTVAGQHWVWAGNLNGRDRVVHETVWRMHESVAPEWPQGRHSITIEGEPRMHLQLAADYVSDGLMATAMHAVNAIPSVCVAPTGIQTLLDLPALTGYGTLR